MPAVLAEEVNELNATRRTDLPVPFGAMLPHVDSNQSAEARGCYRTRRAVTFQAM